MNTDTTSPGWASGRTEWGEIARTDLVPGIAARSRSGDQLSATLFSLDPGAVVPEHAHPNDEFGYVVAGHIRVWCGGDEFDVGPGESFFVAGDQHHRAVAAETGCELLECYAPPRIPSPPTATRTS